MRTENNKTKPSTRNYFVDECGDSTLFSRKGKVLIGTEGCSRFFMLGLLDVPDPATLQHALDDLRTQLKNDAYFQNVPSMRPEARKTAIAFHAKDDIPEVRKEVFALLRKTDGLRFFAVVSDKWCVLDYVRQRNERDTAYRYHPNELYDYLVRRLFKNLLHKDSAYEIVFSRRGRSDRTAALHRALEAARERFAGQWGVVSSAPKRVTAGRPADIGGLQAVDYFIWALQRLYERGEERYVSYLWPAFCLVQDLDDKRKAEYGVYYTQNKQLNAMVLKWREQNKKPGI